MNNVFTKWRLYYHQLCRIITAYLRGRNNKTFMLCLCDKLTTTRTTTTQYNTIFDLCTNIHNHHNYQLRYVNLNTMRIMRRSILATILILTRSLARIQLLKPTQRCAEKFNFGLVWSVAVGKSTENMWYSQSLLHSPPPQHNHPKDWLPANFLIEGTV